MNVSRHSSERARFSVSLLLVAAVVVAGAYITWARLPAEHRRRPWAEDANVFLFDAVRHGPWNVVVEGYAGYQHLIPRLVIAANYPFFDIVRYPMLVFAICSVLTGLAAAAVLWLARDLVPWLPARLTLATITVLLPLSAQETVGNLADLHVYAMWLAPWLLLYRPRKWSTSAGWAVVTFLVVMTEVQAVFFLWIIAFRLRRAEVRAFPIFAAYLSGAAWQIVTALLVSRPPGEGPLSIGSTTLGWMINTVIPIVQADPDAVRAIIRTSGVLLAWLILIPIVVAAGVVFWKGATAQRVLTAALLLGSAATYTGSVWANSSNAFRYAEVGLEHIDALAVNIRYGVPSGMFLIAVIPVAAAVLVDRARDAPASEHRTSTRVHLTAAIAAICCSALIVLLWHGSLHVFSLRTTVPEWPTAARAAIDECQSVSPPTTVTLPVAPWRSVTLSCHELLAVHR